MINMNYDESIENIDLSTCEIISSSFNSKVIRDNNQNSIIKKIISVNNLCESDKSTLKDTAEKLMKYEHENLRKNLEFEEIEINGNSLLIIKQEYMENSFNKFKYDVYSNDVFSLSYDKLIIIIKQILEFLAYLCDNNTYHGNLNTNNIFIDENLKVKISDFQLNRNIFSSIFESSEDAVEYPENYFYNENSHNYISPDIILGGDQDIKGDMWALGTLILNILSNQILFNGYSKITTVQSIFRILGSPKNTNLCILPYYNPYFSSFESKNVREAIEEILNQSGIFINCNFIIFLANLLSYDKNERISPYEALKSNLFK